MPRWVMVCWAVVFALVAALMFVHPALAQEGDAPSPALKDLSNYALWSMLLAPMTSAVTAIINRCDWPGDVKLLAFFVFSTIAAAGNAHFNGDLDFHDWSRAFLVIAVGGLLFYQMAKGGLKTLEARTTRSSGLRSDLGP